MSDFFPFAATVNKVFPNTEASKINSTLGDFLKNNRAKNDAKNPANHEQLYFVLNCI